jgi:hypothetical protein
MIPTIIITRYPYHKLNISHALIMQEKGKQMKNLEGRRLKWAQREFSNSGEMPTVLEEERRERTAWNTSSLLLFFPGDPAFSLTSPSLRGAAIASSAAIVFLLRIEDERDFASRFIVFCWIYNLNRVYFSIYR